MLGLVRHAGRPIELLISLAALAACAFPSATVASGRSAEIPDLRGASVENGYTRLHKDGFKVSIPHGFVVDSLDGGGEILQTSPSPGRQASVGSTVSLAIGCRGCSAGSPAVPTHIPVYRVPEFVGQPLSAVTRWIKPKILYYTEHFGPLHSATAARFAENYRVTRQHPAPGTMLRLGIGRKISPNSGSFSPTPLIVWLTQSP